MAGTPVTDETKMAFVCVCVCKETKRTPETVCMWVVQGWVCSVFVCVLCCEMVNNLQPQTPDTATTVLGRASASGKQPSIFIYVFFTFSAFVSCPCLSMQRFPQHFLTQLVFKVLLQTVKLELIHLWPSTAPHKTKHRGPTFQLVLWWSSVFARKW